MIIYYKSFYIFNEKFVMKVDSNTKFNKNNKKF